MRYLNKKRSDGGFPKILGEKLKTLAENVFEPLSEDSLWEDIVANTDELFDLAETVKAAELILLRFEEPTLFHFDSLQLNSRNCLSLDVMRFSSASFLQWHIAVFCLIPRLTLRPQPNWHCPYGHDYDGPSVCCAVVKLVEIQLVAKNIFRQ